MMGWLGQTKDIEYDLIKFTKDGTIYHNNYRSSLYKKPHFVCLLCNNEFTRSKSSPSYVFRAMPKEVRNLKWSYICAKCGNNSNLLDKCIGEYNHI
jgi:transposase-like protein